MKVRCVLNGDTTIYSFVVDNDNRKVFNFKKTLITTIGGKPVYDWAIQCAPDKYDMLLKYVLTSDNEAFTDAISVAAEYSAFVHYSPQPYTRIYKALNVWYVERRTVGNYDICASATRVISGVNAVIVHISRGQQRFMAIYNGRAYYIIN